MSPKAAVHKSLVVTRLGGILGGSNSYKDLQNVSFQTQRNNKSVSCVAEAHTTKSQNTMIQVKMGKDPVRSSLSKKFELFSDKGNSSVKNKAAVAAGGISFNKASS